MSPQVSVLLTSYNRAAMLREAIGSVRAQTFQDFELIILDDNSAPGSGVPEVLAGYWGQPGIRIYKSGVADHERKLRTRYAVNINTGLTIARGAYITYLCDDDLYLPRRLEVMVARLDEGDCDVVYGWQRLDEDGRQKALRPAERVLDRAACVVDHSSVMHTAAAARAVGGWDEDPFYWRQGDAAFFQRLNAAGYLFHPVGSMDEPLDVHRYHAMTVGALGPPR